jgi:hypothetical protein
MDLLLRSKDKEIMYLVLLLQQQMSFKKFSSTMQKIISPPELFSEYIKIIEEIYTQPDIFKLVFHYTTDIRFMQHIISFHH